MEHSGMTIILTASFDLDGSMESIKVEFSSLELLRAYAVDRSIAAELDVALGRAATAAMDKLC